MQTLGAICIQLYHQCFEQVWQHNFTSIIGLRRSTQRHRSSKVGTSIVNLRKSTHRSSKVDTSIIDLRRSTHIDLRRLKAETSHRQPNIAPTFRQFVTEYCPPRRSIIIIPKILRGKNVLYINYDIRRKYTRPCVPCGILGVTIDKRYRGLETDEVITYIRASPRHNNVRNVQ